MSDSLDRLPREAIIAHLVLQGWEPMTSAPVSSSDRDCFRLVHLTDQCNYSYTHPTSIRFNRGWAPSQTQWYRAPWDIVPIKFLRVTARAETSRWAFDKETEFTVRYRSEDCDEY